MKKKRVRDIPLHIMLSKQELEQIQARMDEAGTINRSAFIRRMLMKGYVVNVDTSFVSELLSLQRRCVNNLKQISAHAKAHEIYVDEVATLQKSYDDLWGLLSDLLKYLSAIMEL